MSPRWDDEPPPGMNEDGKLNVTGGRRWSEEEIKANRERVFGKKKPPNLDELVKKL